MHGKLLATLACLALALVCSTEAATNDEVFGLINHLAVEQELKLTKTLTDTIEQSLDKATTIPQRMCIRGQLPSAHKAITDPIDDMWQKLTAEYQKMTPAQIQRLNLNSLTTRLKYKYNSAVSNIEAKLKKIKKCTL